MGLKKTIIYVGGFELPDKNGAAQRVIANGKIFRELGYNVVFLGVSRELDASTDIWATESNYFGFTCFHTSYPSTKGSWVKTLVECDSVRQLIEGRYQGDVAAVICYNHPAIAQWNIRRLCIKHHVKYMADVTEWYESSGAGVVFGLVKWFDTTLRMRVMHRLADALITTSSIITKFYATNKNLPIVELPSLYDKEIIQIHAREVVTANKVFKWIYAGSPFNATRVDRKRENVKDRLDAVVMLTASLNENETPVELSVYGVTREEYLKVFPEHLETLNQHRSRILFFGKKPHNEIMSSLQNSDFSIFFRKKSRLTEAGFPTKLAESISSGIPVITNYLGNLESYREGVPGLFFVDFLDLNKCMLETKEILNMEHTKFVDMRAACVSTYAFDYHNYIQAVKKFLNGVNLS